MNIENKDVGGRLGEVDQRGNFEGGGGSKKMESHWAKPNEGRSGKAIC